MTKERQPRQNQPGQQNQPGKTQPGQGEGKNRHNIPDDPSTGKDNDM